jgi:hypothetical protein
MSSLAPSGPGAPGSRPAHLQPEEADAYDWADNARERQGAARIDRLAGDRDLISELRRCGFTGPEYQRTAEELVRYGVAVMKAWMMTGTIFEKCARRGRAVQRPAAGALDAIEAESMAGEVVTVALAHFRDEVLLPGVWDPAKGASLTTFFIGQCILRFPNIYRNWLAQVPDYDLGQDGLLRRGDGWDLEDEVLNERAQVEALRLVRNEDARKAMVLWGYGYTYAEIGERLGKTEKAVERMIDYGRQQARRGRGTA